MSFKSVERFEAEIAAFFNAPYGVAVDSCSHGIEICLRRNLPTHLEVPKRTYVSIPFLAAKLGLPLRWRNENWEGYYYIGDTNIIDAAVLWGENTYIPNTFMCLSFQFQKHLSLGRGGMILTDNQAAAEELKKMSYDGRSPHTPWRDQDIDTMGYHYYMTPETAQLGLEKLPEAINIRPRKWQVTDWPDLTQMKVFK